MKSFFVFIIDLITPRFITEDVALELRDGSYHIVCSVQDVDEHESFDGVISVRSFTWLGICIFPKSIGDVRPWNDRNIA